jgi:hypothetical protein
MKRLMILWRVKKKVIKVNWSSVAIDHFNLLVSKTNKFNIDE